mmetsp:Transcript_40899/g.96049  ORF Transcript_40899/g.96049 Transcript_40899/m.96049 type:complete len:212 (-) Transcript_40899:2962-3597(-)
MICICCTALKSVHLPCRMMSMHGLMDGERLVKGAAVDASPSCTIGVSSRPSRSLRADFAAPAAKALPCFFCILSCSFFISSLSRAYTALTAAMWPITPVSSPRCLLASISSSTHSCCFETSSRRFRAKSSPAFFDTACCLCAISFFCSAKALSASTLSSASCSPSFLSPLTFALPKPLRRAMPTSASRRAPTSLPPSPHIMVETFWLAFTA